MTTIRELRRERRWTQFDLALAVGVQPQTVYLWESGRRQPQVSQMRKLGEVFGRCSDEIELVSTREPYRAAPHQARAERRYGELAPGRNHSGRAMVRGAEAGRSDRGDT
jgi:DNA-binding XRE family transcriptional regulator